MDWTAAPDSLGKLALLQQGADEGLITGLEDSPFRVITDDPLDMREGGFHRGEPAMRHPDWSRA